MPLEVDDSGSVNTVDPICPTEWLSPAALGCFARTEKTVHWVYPVWAFPDRCDERAEECESVDYGKADAEMKGLCYPSGPSCNVKNQGMGESRGLGAADLWHRTGLIIMKGVGKPAGGPSGAVTLVTLEAGQSQVMTKSKGW